MVSLGFGCTPTSSTDTTALSGTLIGFFNVHYTIALLLFGEYLFSMGYSVILIWFLQCFMWWLFLSQLLRPLWILGMFAFWNGIDVSRWLAVMTNVVRCLQGQWNQWQFPGTIRLHAYWSTCVKLNSWDKTLRTYELFLNISETRQK